MPRVLLTATIPAGAYLSNAIDLRTASPLLLYAPSAWTPAKVTFLLSFDATFYKTVLRNLPISLPASTRPVSPGPTGQS